MEKSFAFNSVNGDRRYLAEDFREYFSSFIGNGIFPNPSTGLQVYSNNDMTITVKEGKGWINGAIYINTDDLILNIDPADGVLNRIDRIVLRFDTLNREIKTYVKKGVFASTPTSPVLQRDADIYELALADVNIKAGSIEVLQSNINDLRLNYSLCGIVVGTVKEIDTTTLYLRLQAYIDERGQEVEQWISDSTTAWGENFYNWFETVKDVLDEDTAGNLLNKILDLVAKDTELETKINGVKEEIETNINETLEDLKQSVSSGKQFIATSITDKGVPTSGSDTFPTMASNVGKIDTKTPIAADELGVIEWKDGTHQGFKEITSSKITLPETERRLVNYFRQYVTQAGFYTNNCYMTQDYYLYGSGRSGYAIESRVSKVDREYNMLWQYQLDLWVEKIIEDNQKNILVLHGNVSEGGFKITKFDPEGNIKWVKTFAGEQTINDITIDKFDNIYALRGNLYTGQKSRVYKINGNTGEEIKFKDYNYTSDGYVMNYNKKLNRIVFGTEYQIIIIDTELESIKETSPGRGYWVSIFLDDKGNIYASTNSGVVKYNSDGIVIWDYSSRGGKMVINDLEECYFISGAAIYKLSPLGVQEYLYTTTSTKKIQFLKDNLFAVSGGGSAQYKEMYFYMDNFKVTYNILLDTKYLDPR